MPQPKPARKRPPKKRRRRRATKRRALPLVPVLLGAAAVAAVVVAVLSLGSDSQATVSDRIVTVSQGVVQSVVSGSGNLEPANQLDVSFGTTGRITKIYVEEGDHVSKGDLLGKLDDASQRVDLAQAQAQLVDARDALTKAETAATENTADTSGSGTTIAVAAQVTPTATPSVTATPSATPTPTPRASATPTPTASPTGNARSGGGNGSSNAGGSGSSSNSGSTQSVESASAAVQSAELAVQQAQDALDATTLRAPAAGTIASISNAVGDTVGGSQSGSSGTSSAFLVLAQLSKLKLEVALSESDIGKVEVGQKATVTINAASGEEVGAHVSSIGVLSSSSSSDSSQGTGTSNSSGAVSYPVMVTLDQTTDGVRAGMSATADIVTSQASGIVVPNQALRGSTVTLVANGQRTTQRVETGVVGDSTTQVVSGLQSGDRVVITSTSALAGGAASGATGQQGRFGGGGLGGAAGGFGGGGFGGAGGGGGFRRGG